MLFVEINVFYYYLIHITYYKHGKEQDTRHNHPMGIIVAETILQAEAQSTQTKTRVPIPESTQTNNTLVLQMHSTTPVGQPICIP